MIDVGKGIVKTEQSSQRIVNRIGMGLFYMRQLEIKKVLLHEGHWESILREEALWTDMMCFEKGKPDIRTLESYSLGCTRAIYL